MIDAPSGGAPEQAPRWDLVDTKSCGGGIRFLAPYLIVWGYVDIYIGGRSTSVEQQGAHEGGGAPGRGGHAPYLVAPVSFLDVGSKSPGSYLLRKSRSRRFHSVWTPFDIPFLRNPKTGKKTVILGWASG